MEWLHYWAFPFHYIKSKKGKATLRRWAKKIYSTYNGTCARCGYKVGGEIRLEAHHIYPKSLYPRRAFKANNGIALCEECHRTAKDSYHRLNGIKGNVRMIKRWLKETS